MPRRKRRPKPSEYRPGDEYVAKLKKTLRKGARRSFPATIPRGTPATPKPVVDEEENRTLSAAPMPRIPIPGFIHERPPPQKVGAFSVEKITVPRTTPLPSEHGLEPASPPLTHFPEGDATTESEPQTVTEPVCPLLGASCVGEWCRWWDAISAECLLVSLNSNLSILQGKLQALTDYLHYRLGGD